MDLINLEEESLTKWQENFCETTGIFGILISLTCLIQQLVFMNAHWITYCITVVYILSAMGYILLAKKSTYAFIILLISSILVFLLNALFIMMLTFSLALLILLLYSIAIVTLFMLSGVQKQLNKKAAFEKAEKDKWNNVVY